MAPSKHLEDLVELPATTMIFMKHKYADREFQLPLYTLHGDVTQVTRGTGEKERAFINNQFVDN